MRILHVIDSLDPKFGGPPAVALRLATAQRIQGDAVSILTHRESSDAAERISASFLTISGIDSVSIIAISRPTGRLNKALDRGTRDYIVAHRKDFDVIQVHGTWDPAARAGMAGANSAGIPYVVMPHGALDPWAMNQSLSKAIKKRLALGLQIRSLINGASFIHSLNVHERSGIELHKFRTNLEVIPNGVFESEFDQLPAPGMFRSAFPQLGDRPFVLFLSRLHYKKGLDFLAKGFYHAHKRNPNLQLVVAGPDEGQRAIFIRSIQEVGLSEHVHVVGPLYSTLKYAALVDAAAFCLPSRMEGFSIAILEALACGCPVVISKQCNFPEINSENAGIMVDLDPIEIGEGILRLLSDSHFRSAVVTNGKALVFANYTWSVISKMLRAAYVRKIENQTEQIVDRELYGDFS
jgi:glycosyltransferase involved in cell wall biosynthesis